MTGPWAKHTYTHTYICTQNKAYVCIVPTMCWILQCYPDYCICKVQKSKRKLPEPPWQSKFWHMTTSTWVQGSCPVYRCAEMAADFSGHFWKTAGAFLFDIQTRCAMSRKLSSSIGMHTVHQQQHAHTMKQVLCPVPILKSLQTLKQRDQQPRYTTSSCPHLCEWCQYIKYMYAFFTKFHHNSLMS